MRPDTRHFGRLRAIFQLTHPILGAASMRCSLPGRVIFQLTHPVWKCSGVANLPQIMQAPFQLTHPMRGTTSSPPSLRCPCFISTRAPMRGATTRKSGRNTNQSNFNSRTHEGCDMTPILPSSVIFIILTPAPTWGATRHLMSVTLSVEHFNSRTPH